MPPSPKRLARDQTDRKSSSQAALEQAIKRVEALSTTHSLASYLQHFEDCIAPLKAGAGLLGSKEEEAAYGEQPLFEEEPKSRKEGGDEDEEADNKPDSEEEEEEDNDKEFDSDDSTGNTEGRPSAGDWVRIDEYLGLRHEEHIVCFSCAESTGRLLTLNITDPTLRH